MFLSLSSPLSKTSINKTGKKKREAVNGGDSNTDRSWLCDPLIPEGPLTASLLFSFFFVCVVCLYPAPAQTRVFPCELFPSACLPPPALSVLIYSRHVHYAGAEPN